MNEEGIHWVEPAPVDVPPAIRELAGGPAFLAEALVRRGLSDPLRLKAFLDPHFYQPSDPANLPDLSVAADRLEQAIQQGEQIGVWGDFDVDGQTATTLLVQALSSLGAKVSYYIPVRARESHGVGLAPLGGFLASGVQLVLTCDTGITAHDAVVLARDKQVDFIITDHHTLPEILPSALAVVNPQRLPGNSPLAALCGVGCAYKLAEELLHRAGRAGEAAALLDLVALGTIADLALLAGDNRYLVQRGLESMRTAPRPAIQVMLELAEIAYAQLSEEQVSFTLAPRMNALGRLDDANPAVPFLLSSSIAAARPMAARLEALNARRKLLCDQVFQAAQAQISRDRSLLDHPVLLLSHATWPSGVLGIVASRLNDLYRRPVVLIASPPGELARASARSVEGIHITQAISSASALLASFGGHPMAAGFSLDPARIPDFQRALDQAVAQQAARKAPVAELVIDAIVPLDSLNLQMVDALDQLAPFGPGNPPLVLASHDLALQSQLVFGKNGEHLRLIVEDSSGISQKVIWWQGAGSPLPEGRFDLAYSVRASNYMAQRTIEVEWITARTIPESLPLRLQRTIQTIQDERGCLDPDAALAPYLEMADCLVYAEGEHTLRGKSAGRTKLTPAAALVVWTSPPGRVELQSLLDLVAPSRVVWFGIPSAVDQPAAFLTRLTGLVQFAIKKRQGGVQIEELGSACAQRLRTIRLGIAWLAARGHLTVQSDHDHEIMLSANGTADLAAAARIARDLEAILRETAAYRAYCQQVELRLILEPA